MAGMLPNKNATGWVGTHVYLHSSIINVEDVSDDDITIYIYTWPQNDGTRSIKGSHKTITCT